MSRESSRLARIAVLAFAAGGCGSDPLVCTDELVAVPVTVANRTGEALASLTVSDTVLRTGVTLDITGEHPSGDLPPDGFAAVIVFSDAFADAVLPTGDPVAVAISAGDRAASAVFEFGTDGCHVRKLAGPDTLALE